MKINRHKYFQWLMQAATVGAFAFTLASCVSDDSFEREVVDPSIDLENSLVVPLKISMSIDASTRATGDYEDGSDREHYIDFETDGQCYGIFFRDNKFLYIKRLYQDDIIGSESTTPDEDPTRVEYSVPVMAYVPRPENYELGNDHDDLPNKILVILNGGLLKSKLDALGEQLLNNHTQDDVQQFLDFKWKFNDYEVPVIGINRKGMFTMSNSAYLDANGNLMTAAKLEPKKFTLPTVSNMKNPAIAGTVYLERMVAKFSAPTFSTEVIGSDKVFRPDQNAVKVVIYQWDKDNVLYSSEKNWRIHLIGWTINGRETQNYVFKKIKTGADAAYTDWRFSDWNRPADKRSFWSEDPHYNADTDYYPWQYRRAIDVGGISFTDHSTEAVLRYFSFNDIGYWNEEWLTISENTFDPAKYPDKNANVLDSRAAVLAGPHLIVTAELYLESPKAGNEDYLGQFATVDNLYGDRLRRYYLTEKDCFKMFIRDFNSALATQENMKFSMYDWGDTGEQDSEIYTLKPTGKCRLRYDPVCDENDPSYPYKGRLLTAGLVDTLLNNNIVTSLFASATVKDGDGRIFPWFDGIVVRDEKGKKVPIYNSAGTLMPDEGPERANMRKSLLLEWFGPVDHYNKGHMYYSGAITHHSASSLNSSTSYFGAVRNHWYKFIISSINSLGTPIDDDSQPIIPDKYNYRDQMGVQLQVLGWHGLESEVQLR